MELFLWQIITEKYKKRSRNKIVSTFLCRTRESYDFVDDNPLVIMMRVDYMNDTSIIRRNPKVTAINSAIDITSQICTDSFGDYIY